ncbi:hypothetical protein BH11MYX1_BH11MYX1_13590 [soil metagenome]
MVRSLLCSFVMRALILASAWLLSTSLLACGSSSSGDSVTGTEYDDVAQNVGTTTASKSGGGDVNAMADVVVMAGGTLPLGFTAGTGGAVSGSLLGIDYNFQLVCRNGDGATLPVCNTNADLADVSISWGGTLALPNVMTTMDRQGQWSLANIQESSVKLAGNGTFSYDWAITNPATNITAAYHLDYAAAYMSVFIDKASLLATAGEIEYDIQATKSVTGETPRFFSVVADVHFNGDGTATIELDGTHDYTLELATGVVTSATYAAVVSR